MTDDYDSPWKDIIELYFADFLAFFFPEAHADIDWACGYESLDTELQQIVRDAELGRRLADKLMKVWRRDGEEQIVLIHIEVQGGFETDFAKRMYVYNYRLFDRYERPVVSLAVLGDDNPRWRPDRFEHTLWGCQMTLVFPVVKLNEYAARTEELSASANPFAVVVLGHLQTRATRYDAQGRLQSKLRLVRALYERGYNRDTVLELFRFLDWLLKLPDELEQRFQAELEAYEASMSTPYITTLERRGIEKGIERGIERGISKGIEKGKALQAQISLLTILEARFGSLPTQLRERIEAMEDLTDLETLLKAAATAASLAVFQRDFLPPA